MQQLPLSLESLRLLQSCCCEVSVGLAEKVCAALSVEWNKAFHVWVIPMSGVIIGEIDNVVGVLYVRYVVGRSVQTNLPLLRNIAKQNGCSVIHCRPETKFHKRLYEMAGFVVCADNESVDNPLMECAA